MPDKCSRMWYDVSMKKAALALCCLFCLTSCSLFRPPVAIIDAEPWFGIAPLTVVFDASRSYDDIDSYRWSFGGVGETASHTFDEGDHEVWVQVTNTAGQQDKAVMVVRVRPALTGRWVGALLPLTEGAPVTIELNLVYQAGQVSGTVVCGGDTLPILESSATYQRLFIAAGANVAPAPFSRCEIVLDGTPGETLSGVATVNGRKYTWLASR